MRKQPRTICAVLLLLSLLSSTRTRGAQFQSLTGRAQRQSATAQSPELNEAKRLSEAVVKLFGEGKYDEALPLAKRAVEIREKALGRAHPLVADALVNLAEIYLAKRDYVAAESPLERVLKINEKDEGADTLSNSVILDKLAVVNFANGYFNKTESLYQRALAIREKALGADAAETGNSLQKLAEFYRLRGKYDKASELFRRALAIKEKALGNESQEVGNLLERYSCVLKRVGRGEEAKQMLKRGVAILFKDVQRASEEDQSGEILNGKARSLPKPYYPAEAKADRLGGTVKVRVVIDEGGVVIRACSISGPFQLALPSESAAYLARFTPTLVGDKPTRVMGIITYRFVAR